MQHTRLRVVLVASFEVEARVYTHIARRNVDVLVVRDVYACRIVHLIIGTCSDGETADGAFSMVEHGVDVGWKHALVLIVHLDGRVSPPQKGLRNVRTVIESALDFQIGTARTQSKTCHSLLVEHLFHLANPYRYRAVGLLFDTGVNGHEGRRAMMLRPVELDAATDPRARKSYKGWFDNVVVVHEVALCYLVVCHLHTSAQLGQHHHLDILVFQPNGQIVFVHPFVADCLDDGVGIDHATRSLIDTFLQKHRVFLRLSHLVGRYCHQFSPGFYHFFQYYCSLFNDQFFL